MSEPREDPPGKITIKLYDPLKEEVINEIIHEFDESYIYLDGTGQSGWWGKRAPYGTPSHHKREDEKGLHITGCDFSKERLPACLDISRDRRTIEVDRLTAWDVVEILSRVGIPYELDADAATKASQPYLIELLKSRKLSQKEVRRISEKNYIV